MLQPLVLGVHKMATFDFVPSAQSHNPKNLVSAAELADLCYKLPASIHFKARGDWAFNRVRVQQVTNAHSRAVVLANDHVILVAFRGTVPSSIRSWMVNLDPRMARGPKGLVHRGFKAALARHMPRLLAIISSYRDQSQPVWFVGHSQGGALAMIAISRFVYPRDLNPGGLMTFGQPRVGDHAFVTLIDGRVGTRFSRLINGNDVFPHFPRRIMRYMMRYRHSRRFLYFPHTGQLQELFSYVPRRGPTRNIRDHFMKNYLGRALATSTVTP